MPENELLNRRFGIEMEFGFHANREQVRAAVREGLQEVPNSRPALYYGMTQDGGGWEVKTPPSTWRNWDEIKAVTRKLRPIGYYTRSSGMHCHMDNRDMSPQDLLMWTILWASLEPSLFALVHRHRRDNEWCESLNGVFGWPEIRRQAVRQRAQEWVAGIARYALHPMSHHGTSEIRLHHASLDPKKQRGWLLLLQMLMYHAKTITDVSVFDRYRRLDVADGVRFMQERGSELLPPDLGRWLRRHLAWRLERYSEISL